MLSKDECVLVVIDVQGKLAHMMHNKEDLFNNIQIMIQGAKALDIPVIWVEQYPEGLGGTIEEIAGLLEGAPVEKVTFNSCLNDEFVKTLSSYNRQQVLVVGIETHICVYQTVMGLLKAEYDVHVVADGVSSRTEDNKLIGLEKMKDGGAQITSTETALFELVKIAEGPEFKAILKLVK
ncbi:hydrolase [Dethiobacter alkaliphilus]|uniref:hydrolase n=1 Tax=Dethiobacter alkaliphilus TaxID=427926 RepID=UPI002226C85E|nr:hydrolase [Dethiobacter alkaliphilus]MCW3490959.1 hydrolase [Dethiobacter alkaliphilus]